MPRILVELVLLVFRFKVMFGVGKVIYLLSSLFVVPFLRILLSVPEKREKEKRII